MSYKNKYGITQIIKDRFNNLSINWDSDNGVKQNHYPILLHTPDMENTEEHYHIKLNKKQAKVLHTWLTEYLKDK